MEDTPKDRGARARLVRELQRKGITDEAVLHAFMSVPRHFFVPAFLREHAYGGNALPIACGQTISQPFTVAYQSQLLEVRPKQKILEIGTGSGFQAAILYTMGAHVYSIERQYDLYAEAEARFQQLRLRVAHKHGDGYMGWKEFAPYDRILVTCAAPFVPDALLQQLKAGGALLIPLGEGEQRMTRIVRVGEDSFESSEYGTFQFVPMLRNKTSHVKK